MILCLRALGSIARAGREAKDYLAGLRRARLSNRVPSVLSQVARLSQPHFGVKKVAEKHPKLGRRPVADADRRTIQRLNVRFSPNEIAALKRAAKQSGHCWSDWVRSRLGL